MANRSIYDKREFLLSHMKPISFSDTELKAGTYLYNADVTNASLESYHIWVISYVDNDNIFICDATAAKLIYEKKSKDELLKQIAEYQWTLGRLEHLDINRSALTGPQQERLERRKAFINAVMQYYGESLECFATSKYSGWSKFCSIQNFERKTGKKLLTTWLQLGKTDYALYDGRMTSGKKKKSYTYKTLPGAKFSDGQHNGKVLDERDKMIFEKYLRRVKSTSYRTQTLSDIYVQMVADTPEWLAAENPNQLPSLRQWYSYVASHTTEAERLKGRKGNLEYWNNCAAAPGDAVYDAAGPMDICEIDETEVDLYVVEYLNGKLHVIGRPIVYTIVDVYSRMIVAVSCGFDNNSVEGAIAALANLATRKIEFVGKKTYGKLSIDPKAWPDACLPNRLRSDHGAEYTSKAYSEILGNLGITAELVPVASGRSKGAVERGFRALMKNQLVNLEHMGKMTHMEDSDHKQSACLTIEEYEQLLIYSVVVHNTAEIKGYHATIDQLHELHAITPANLWQYGIEHYGAPRQIRHVDDFLYGLLWDITEFSTISKHGIRVRIGGTILVYWDENNSFINRLAIMYQSGSMPFNCKIDRRNLRQIYYIDPESQCTVQVPLYAKNNRNMGAKNFTWSQIEEISKRHSKAARQQEFTDAKAMAFMYIAQQDVISQAKDRLEEPAEDKDILANRKTAKEMNHILNPITNSVTTTSEENHLPDAPNSDTDEFSVSDETNSISLEDLILNIEED